MAAQTAGRSPGTFRQAAWYNSAVMLRRLPQAFWMFCAALLLAQSILPASALASVSVRCVGMPAATPACAEASVIPVADTTQAQTQSGFLCPVADICAATAPWERGGTGQADTVSSPSYRLCPAVLSLLRSAPKSLLATHERASEDAQCCSRARSSRHMRLFFLHSQSVSVTLTIRSCTISHRTDSAHSHGLRAPPVS